MLWNSLVFLPQFIQAFKQAANMHASKAAWFIQPEYLNYKNTNIQWNQIQH